MTSKNVLQSVVMTIMLISILLVACYLSAMNLGEKFLGPMWLVLAVFLPPAFAFSSHSLLAKKAVCASPSKSWGVFSGLTILIAWLMCTNSILMVAKLVERVIYEGDISVNSKVAMAMAMVATVVISLTALGYLKANTTPLIQTLNRGALGALIVVYTISGSFIMLAICLDAVRWRF